jgi:hypothetical protein
MVCVFDWSEVNVFVLCVIRKHLGVNVIICLNLLSLTNINMYINPKLTDFPNTQKFCELMNTHGGESILVNLATFCEKTILIANTGQFQPIMLIDSVYSGMMWEIS